MPLYDKKLPETLAAFEKLPVPNFTPGPTQEWINLAVYLINSMETELRVEGIL